MEPLARGALASRASANDGRVSGGMKDRTAWLWGPLAQPGAARPVASRTTLGLLLLAAFALRLGVAWRLPSIHHADEVYQVAEQAHRSVHGYGIVPWEFRTASRTAILPALVTPIYRVRASAFARSMLQAALFCAASLIPVWVACRWAARLHGARGAVLAAVMMATWFELVYFAPKATADAVCGYLLIAGLYLARPSAPSRAVFAAGVSLAMALAVRVQIAPAACLALLLAALAGGRARTPALAGGVAAGLALAGAIEWRWWGAPFQGQIGYLTMELTHHASRYFAREPPIFFAKQYILMYGLALPLVAYLVAIGARQAPMLLVAAAAVIAPFHFVGHKEYRFVVAALPMVVLMMSLGAASLLARVDPAGRPATLPVFLGGWIVAMLAVSFGDTYRPLWTRHGNHVRAFHEIGAQPDACGVGLVGIRWWQTPGYSGLGRDVPIYEIASDDRAERLRSAANYLVQATKAAPPPPPFVPWREYTRPLQYVYRRPGGCVPDEASKVVRPPGIPGLE